MADQYDKPPPYQQSYGPPPPPNKQSYGAPNQGYPVPPLTNPGYPIGPPQSQGYQVGPPPPMMTQYGTIAPNGQFQPQGPVVAQQAIVVVGGCPACRVGVLEDDYTCLGVCCAVVFFPLGLLFCLAMKQRHCPNCGAMFG